MTDSNLAGPKSRYARRRTKSLRAHQPAEGGLILNEIWNPTNRRIPYEVKDLIQFTSNY